MEPEWVIASTDCGFPQGPFGCRGRPSIMCPSCACSARAEYNGGSESNKRNEQTLGSYPLKPVCRPAPCSSDDR